MSNNDPGGASRNNLTISSPTPGEVEQPSTNMFTIPGPEDAAIKRSTMFGTVPEQLPINTSIMADVDFGFEENEFYDYTMAQIMDPGPVSTYAPSIIDSHSQQGEVTAIYSSATPISVSDEAEFIDLSVFDSDPGSDYDSENGELPSTYNSAMPILVPDEAEVIDSSISSNASETSEQSPVERFIADEDVPSKAAFGDGTMASTNPEEAAFDNSTMTSIFSEQSSSDYIYMSWSAQSHAPFLPDPNQYLTPIPSFGPFDALRFMDQLHILVSIPYRAPSKL
jgi:hypothetical protein